MRRKQNFINTQLMLSKVRGRESSIDCLAIYLFIDALLGCWALSRETYAYINESHRLGRWWQALFTLLVELKLCSAFEQVLRRDEKSDCHRFAQGWVSQLQLKLEEEERHHLFCLTRNEQVVNWQFKLKFVLNVDSESCRTRSTDNRHELLHVSVTSRLEDFYSIPVKASKAAWVGIMDVCLVSTRQHDRRHSSRENSFQSANLPSLSSHSKRTCLCDFPSYLPFLAESWFYKWSRIRLCWKTSPFDNYLKRKKIGMVGSCLFLSNSRDEEV